MKKILLLLAIFTALSCGKTLDNEAWVSYGQLTIRDGDTNRLKNISKNFEVANSVKEIILIQLADFKIDLSGFQNVRVLYLWPKIQGDLEIINGKMVKKILLGGKVISEFPKGEYLSTVEHLILNDTRIRSLRDLEGSNVKVITLFDNPIDYKSFDFAKLKIQTLVIDNEIFDNHFELIHDQYRINKISSEKFEMILQNGDKVQLIKYFDDGGHPPKQ